MTRVLFRYLGLAALLVGAGRSPAQTIETLGAMAASPSEVNLRSTGTTTVHITFRGVTADITPGEGVFAGDVDFVDPAPAGGGGPPPPPPQRSGFIPRPGTTLGRLPVRHDFSRRSGNTDFTDILSIPASVARRAYQRARDGGSPRIFYTRRFRNRITGQDFFARVALRLSAGGAGSPFALQQVLLRFEGGRAIASVDRGGPVPPFEARIRYNGTGRLRGRWEVVVPGEELPETRDLVPEGTLPLEERALRRRYRVVDRFDLYCPPSGEIVVKGPPAKDLPTRAGGQYRILLRVETSIDRESLTRTSEGLPVQTAGAAGFALPVLRYYVGAGHRGTGADRALPPSRSPGSRPPSIRLGGPQALVRTSPRGALEFHWGRVPEARRYQLEVEGGSGPLASAVLPPNATSYLQPPWVRARPGDLIRWRVWAVDDRGSIVEETAWQTYRVPDAAPTSGPGGR